MRTITGCKRAPVTRAQQPLLNATYSSLSHGAIALQAFNRELDDQTSGRHHLRKEDRGGMHR
jgi:hypothetical protein